MMAAMPDKNAAFAAFALASMAWALPLPRNAAAALHAASIGFGVYAFGDQLAEYGQTISLLLRRQPGSRVVALAGRTNSVSSGHATLGTAVALSSRPLAAAAVLRVVGHADLAPPGLVAHGMVRISGTA